MALARNVSVTLQYFFKILSHEKYSSTLFLTVSLIHLNQIINKQFLTPQTQSCPLVYISWCNSITADSAAGANSSRVNSSSNFESMQIVQLGSGHTMLSCVELAVHFAKES